MSRSATLLIILLVGLIVAIGVYDFYRTHEYKEITIRSGLLNEARRNPYYASRLFLKRMGIPTIKKDNLQTTASLGFPNSRTVLVITSSRSSLSTNRTKDLLEWVESGGHLIATATTDWYYSGDEDEEDKMNKLLSNKESRDPLQRLLGIHTGKRIYLDDEDDAKNQKKKNKKKGTSNKDIITRMIETTQESGTEYEIRLKGVKPLKIQADWFNPLRLSDSHKSASEQIKIRSDNFIIRQKVGNGMVTLLSDLGFIENYHIENSDHAEIFWHLIHGNQAGIDQPEKVWLIHSDEMASLWSILWKNAWAFIVSLTLLFFFWVLHATRRFGPLIPKQPEDRRSLNEHIISSGNFYWKNNKKQLLINSSRNALNKRLERVHPGWVQRSEAEQLKLLSKQLELKPETIHKLLHDNNFEHPDDFTWLVQQLEKIRQSI